MIIALVIAGVVQVYLQRLRESASWKCRIFCCLLWLADDRGADNTWHILSRRGVDRFADLEAVARSFMTWATSMGCGSLGIYRIAFVRQQLERLGIRSQLSQMRYAGDATPSPRWHLTG